MDNLAGPHVGVTALAFSPDGRTLSSGSSGGKVRLWEAAAGRQRAVLEGHTNGITAVAFSPDGTKLASGCLDSKVRLWDRCGRLLQEFEGQSYHVFALAFSPDGTTLAIGGGVKPVGEPRLWDVRASKQRLTLKTNGGPFVALAFSPDGQTRAGGDQAGILLWAIPGGKLLAAGDSEGMVKVWNVAKLR